MLHGLLRTPLRALLLTLLFCFTTGVRAAPLPLTSLDRSEQQAHLQQMQNRLEADIKLSPDQSDLPLSPARIVLRPMFSAQQGSWPFEPFVQNGMFKEIAQYQRQHPRIIVIQGGRATLGMLYRQLSNERILRRHQGGYLLSYPLMIAPDAALVLENEPLFLQAHTGTALINQGALHISNALLTTHLDGQEASAGNARPFLINWAGSGLYLDNASIRDLGYDAYLSRGITTALSPQQPVDTPPAHVVLNGSTLQNMPVGLELQHARAVVSASRFEQMQHYAVDMENSQFALDNNQIQTVKQFSGIRVRGASAGKLVANRIGHTRKSAIEVENFQGQLLVRANSLSNNLGHGILLREVHADSSLLVTDNTIINTQGSALEGINVSVLNVIRNQISHTAEYGISLRNDTATPGPVRIFNNQLSHVGKAMVRTQGIHQILLGDNQFLASQLLQPILLGDLMKYQAPVLQRMLQQQEWINIKLDKVSLLPPS